MKLLMKHLVNPLFQKAKYPSIQTRIGLDLGEARIVELGAENVKSDTDLLSYTMNIAAKICALCPPDQVMIGESVFTNLHISRKKSFIAVSLTKESWNYLDANTNKTYPLFISTMS